MVHELRYSAILVPEFLIQLMFHKELLRPYFGKQLQYNSQITICEPLLTAVVLLGPELNSWCNLQNFGFKLQELQGLICFMQTLIKISNPQGRNPKRAVRNGHNWPIYILRSSGIEPSTLLPMCMLLRCKALFFFLPVVQF